MDTTIGTYCSFYMTVCCPGGTQPGQQTVILPTVVSIRCTS